MAGEVLSWRNDTDTERLTATVTLIFTERNFTKLLFMKKGEYNEYPNQSQSNRRNKFIK